MWLDDGAFKAKINCDYSSFLSWFQKSENSDFLTGNLKNTWRTKNHPFPFYTEYSFRVAICQFKLKKLQLSIDNRWGNAYIVVYA